MRNRTRKENPTSRQNALIYERNRVFESAQLFEQHRDIDGFIVLLKKQLESRGLSVQQLQINLGFNKKVIYSWLRGEKKPSQKYQILVCEYLDIPYSTLALTPNKDGEYACGVRACTSCGYEFALFKKTNYGQMKCEDCKIIGTKFDYGCIENEWINSTLTLEQLVLVLKNKTGKVASITAIRSHFRKLNILRKKSTKNITPCKVRQSPPHTCKLAIVEQSAASMDS